MSVHERGRSTSTEDRALALLGSGLGPETVASALGVTVSAISQLLSDKEFAEKVAYARFQSLSAHNLRDTEYDSIEDALLEKLKNVLPMMYRPMEILKAITVINSAKRRGSSAPDQITQQNTVVNLVLPVQVVHKFTTNAQNQVVEAGQQQLLTMQSNSLLLASKKRNAERLERIHDGTTIPEISTNSSSPGSNQASTGV